MKEMPKSIEAERGLIGALILDPKIMQDVSNELNYQDFYDINNSMIYKVIKGLYQDNKQIDLLNICDDLKRFGELEKIGGLGYLTEIISETTTSIMWKDYLGRIKSTKSKRDLIVLGDYIQKQGYKEELGANEVLLDVKNKIGDFKMGGEFKHIDYKNKIQRSKNELLNTKPNEIIKWGWIEWDNYLGGIYGGKLYIIGADSGLGKSTFINQVCKNISRQGQRVVKYSLEDRVEDIGKEEIYYEINRLRFKENEFPYDWTKFVNNEYGTKESKYYDEKYETFLGLACDRLEKECIIELDKSRQVGINDLVILMEEECKRGTKFFAIDHLHYFEMEKTERHDLEIQNVMHKINEIARKYNVAVFIVAHYRKEKGGDKKYSNDSFKDGSAIKQVANVIIHINRNIENSDSETEFIIGKLRGPIKPKTLIAKFDIGKFEYSFIKTKEQTDKENALIF